MSLDRERLTKLTGSLRASMRLLKEVAILPKAEFLSDAHKQSSAKYNFIAAIEAIIDLAGHWAARAGLRSPKDYADTFQVLFEAGYL
ncbi:MAG: HepT-like ribonuclease domain-containing protein, partial [bacterium]